MKKVLLSATISLLLPAMASASSILKFETMYGVDGLFVGGTQIREVLGDELPWVIKSVKGSLSTSGQLDIKVRGLVFSNDEIVPPDLRGINDESEFRGLVSCLSETDDGKIATINVLTKGFPATRTGNSDIKGKVTLPDSCVAPIVFVMAGSEEKWFAVTGAESESKSKKKTSVK